jgi:hypothetical protein
VRTLCKSRGYKHHTPPGWQDTTDPVALAKIFRAKVCAGLHRLGLLAQVPRSVWRRAWVVHCKHAGQHSWIQQVSSNSR